VGKEANASGSRLFNEIKIVFWRQMELKW